MWEDGQIVVGSRVEHIKTGHKGTVTKIKQNKQPESEGVVFDVMVLNNALTVLFDCDVTPINIEYIEIKRLEGIFAIKPGDDVTYNVPWSCKVVKVDKNIFFYTKTHELKTYVKSFYHAERYGWEKMEQTGEVNYNTRITEKNWIQYHGRDCLFSNDENSTKWIEGKLIGYDEYVKHSFLTPVGRNFKYCKCISL